MCYEDNPVDVDSYGVESGDCYDQNFGGRSGGSVGAPSSGQCKQGGEYAGQQQYSHNQLDSEYDEQWPGGPGRGYGGGQQQMGFQDHDSYGGASGERDSYDQNSDIVSGGYGGMQWGEQGGEYGGQHQSSDGPGKGQQQEPEPYGDMSQQFESYGSMGEQSESYSWV